MTRAYTHPYNDPRIIPLPRNSIDISGQTFSRLTALGVVKHPESDRTCWLFRCSCGNEKIAHRNLVMPLKNRNGKGCTQSCGCLQRERSKGEVEKKVRQPRTYRYVEIEGCTKTVAEWSKNYRLPSHTIFGRMKQGKVGKELIAPVRKGICHTVVRATV